MVKWRINVIAQHNSPNLQFNKSTIKLWST
jgi:hypothetical protein